MVAVASGMSMKPEPVSTCHWMEMGPVPVAVAVNVPEPPSHAVTSKGWSVMVIGVATTVTVKVHWLVLPLLSLAVLVTVVVPIGNANPLTGMLVRFVTVQLSVTLTLKVTLLVHRPGGVFTVRFAGHV